MKQKIIIDTKDGKVKLQFKHFSNYSFYKDCYLDNLGNYHKLTPQLLSEEFFFE